MPSTSNWVGIVFKQYDESAEHFKFHIIVADKSGLLATIYINTVARYSQLPALIQSNQIPISPNECKYLDHDSFVDCSTIKELNKSSINEYLSKNKGHHCGTLPDFFVTKVIEVLKRSKNIETIIKKKFDLVFK